MKKPEKIAPAEGKLAVLTPGLGAVATTFIAGVMATRRDLTKPIGSVTQMGSVRLGRGSQRSTKKVRELVPLAGLDQLRFAAWDVFADNALESARAAGVLGEQHLGALADELAAVEPMPAVFFPEYVKRLHGPHVKQAKDKVELVEALREDIRASIKAQGASRAVAVWCASTEKYIEQQDVHQSVASFERGLQENHPAISASMIYAWACLKEGVPFANGAPNLTVDIPAVHELARETSTPVAGKDFKTGQTLMKTILAAGFRAKVLGLNGWFSTNILGNRDGAVLDDPDNFKTKEVSKLSVLEHILRPEQNPDLYGDVFHKVRINYYPPRGDAKEAWDNIDIFGWMGYPMQIKVNFLCRDSILAAPVVLDLALLMDLAKRASLSDTQEWLSIFFKSPMAAGAEPAQHDLFLQLMRLNNTLRWLAGEETITEPGDEYYD